MSIKRWNSNVFRSGLSNNPLGDHILSLFARPNGTREVMNYLREQWTFICSFSKVKKNLENIFHVEIRFFPVSFRFLRLGTTENRIWMFDLFFDRPKNNALCCFSLFGAENRIETQCVIQQLKENSIERFRAEFC